MRGVYLRKTIKNEMKKIIPVLFIFFTGLLSVFTSCEPYEGHTIQPDSISSLPGITYNDIDGNLYHGVYIGSQIWSKENLRVTRFNDGTPITEIADQLLWNGMSDTIPAYCNYNNDSYLANIYGRLYNRNVIFDTLNIAPPGWRIPTIADWDTLFAHLGGAAVASSKLREAGTDHWIGPNNSSNQSGFTALPGGFRNGSGFTYLAVKGRFWANWPFVSYMVDQGSMVICDSSATAIDGYSIRLIKNQ